MPGRFATLCAVIFCRSATWRPPRFASGGARCATGPALDSGRKSVARTSLVNIPCANESDRQRPAQAGIFFALRGENDNRRDYKRKNQRTDQVHAPTLSDDLKSSIWTVSKVPYVWPMGKIPHSTQMEGNPFTDCITGLTATSAITS